ncbi:MAG: flagellar motor protein MotB [Candidatus Omnitrophica bacterium]|nr:flagellar motor protein MotB [Candidatus Omnitrophota bacterium]
MRLRSLVILPVVMLLLSSMLLTGCTFVFQKGRRVDVEKISKLKNELTDLERAKAELEDRLKNEIVDKDVKVEMLEKGLVITFVAEVLFDSGKDKLRKESHSILDKVAHVLNTTIKDLSVGVEGHTDDVPIKYSGWKTNWELSAARALSVLHYLVQKHNVGSKRLSATGFGEFHPVATNKTTVGRQKNRRVEIVILPKSEKKKR